MQLLGQISASGTAGGTADLYLPGLPFAAEIQRVRLIDQAGVATDAADYITITATGAAARSTAATAITADTTETLTLSGAVVAADQRLRLQVAATGSGKAFSLAVQWWGIPRNALS